MLLTLLIGVLPAALGLTVLLLPSRGRWLGPARTFAVGAALTVVAAELLPASADALGSLALALAAGGLVLPRLADRVLPVPHDLRGDFELGFVALLAHQAFDGVQMGAARGLGTGVVLAIASHGAPLVAAAVLASAEVEGTRRATLRGLMLIASTACGLLASSLVPETWLAAGAPWIAAVIAGFLVHVVTHGLDPSAPPTALDRASELAALAIGVTVTLALLGGGYAHEAHAHHAHDAFGEALVALAASAALPLAAGLALRSALLRTPFAWARRTADAGPEAVALTAWWLGPIAAALHALAAVVGASASDRDGSRASATAAVGLAAGAYVLAFVHRVPQGSEGLLVAGVLATALVRVPVLAVVPPAAALAARGAPIPLLLAGLAVLAASPTRRSELGVAACAAVAALLAAPLLPASPFLATANPAWALLVAGWVAHGLWREGPRAWLVRLGRVTGNEGHHHHHAQSRSHASV